MVLWFDMATPFYTQVTNIFGNEAGRAPLGSRGIGEIPGTVKNPSAPNLRPDWNALSQEERAKILEQMQLQALGEMPIGQVASRFGYQNLTGEALQRAESDPALQDQRNRPRIFSPSGYAGGGPLGGGNPATTNQPPMAQQPVQGLFGQRRQNDLPYWMKGMR